MYKYMYISYFTSHTFTLSLEKRSFIYSLLLKFYQRVVFQWGRKQFQTKINFILTLHIFFNYCCRHIQESSLALCYSLNSLHIPIHTFPITYFIITHFLWVISEACFVRTLLLWLYMFNDYSCGYLVCRCHLSLPSEWTLSVFPSQRWHDGTSPDH